MNISCENCTLFTIFKVFTAIQRKNYSASLNIQCYDRLMRLIVIKGRENNK